MKNRRKREEKEGEIKEMETEQGKEKERRGIKRKIESR